MSYHVILAGLSSLTFASPTLLFLNLQLQRRRAIAIVCAIRQNKCNKIISAFSAHVRMSTIKPKKSEFRLFFAAFIVFYCNVRTLLAELFHQNERVKRRRHLIDFRRQQNCSSFHTLSKWMKKI